MTDPRVETLDGPVVGTRFDGFDRFLGIPFAHPPTGNLRFRAPEPNDAWTKPLVADSYPPHAPQSPSAMEGFMNGGEPVHYDEQNCLQLNIWTPKVDKQRRPVMVWIHGGGFAWGASSSSWYDGSSFAKQHDVVVVSFNYRLGVLGFTYLGDRAASEYSGSGSLGVQDAAAALRWIAVNIANFGGDPRNVTIFGESAGAMSVGTLLALPEATGLFHKAILQSGSASHVRNTEAAAALTSELLQILGEPDITIEKLQQIEIGRLLEAHDKLAAAHLRDGLVSVPVVDGDVLHRAPLEAVRDGEAAEVQILIGTNLDEWQLFALADEAASSMDEASLRREVGALHDDVDRVLATYRARLGEVSPGRLWSAVATDTIFRSPAIALAEAQHHAGGSVWMYLFTWASPHDVLGSCHALEMPFVFNTLDQPTAISMVGEHAPQELATTMHATWAAFARFGDPARGPLGEWPQYESQRRVTMVINEISELEEDPLSDERRLWHSRTTTS